MSGKKERNGIQQHKMIENSRSEPQGIILVQQCADCCSLGKCHLHLLQDGPYKVPVNGEIDNNISISIRIEPQARPNNCENASDRKNTRVLKAQARNGHVAVKSSHREDPSHWLPSYVQAADVNGCYSGKPAVVPSQPSGH